MFKIYPGSFFKNSRSVLKNLAKNESKVGDNNLSCEHVFNDEGGQEIDQEINFLKKTLYDLLEDLTTSKINTNNDEQLNLIINLMLGYDKNDIFNKETNHSKKKRGL